MPKIKKVEEEAYLLIKKRRNNLTTTIKKKVVDNLAGKWKSGGITIKVFENNKYKKKRRSKRKRAEMD